MKASEAMQTTAAELSGVEQGPIVGLQESMLQNFRSTKLLDLTRWPLLWKQRKLSTALYGGTRRASLLKVNIYNTSIIMILDMHLFKTKAKPQICRHRESMMVR